MCIAFWTDYVWLYCLFFTSQLRFYPLGVKEAAECPSFFLLLCIVGLSLFEIVNFTLKWLVITFVSVGDSMLNALWKRNFFEIRIEVLCWNVNMSVSSDLESTLWSNISTLMLLLLLSSTMTSCITNETRLKIYNMYGSSGGIKFAPSFLNQIFSQEDLSSNTLHCRQSKGAGYTPAY